MAKTENKKHGANLPNLRFPGFAGDWEEKRLGEIVKFKTTNSFSRDNLNYEKGSVKNIHYGDIHTKFQTLFDIEHEKVPYVNENISLQRISEENYCQEGDIIFADASEDLNDIGKSIEIVNLNNEKLISGLHTLLARPEPNIFHKGFAGYVLKSNGIRKQISKESQGAKVLGITAGRLSKVNISIPDLDEQRKIAELFSVLDGKIISLKKTVDNLKSQSSLLLNLILEQKIRFKSFENNFPEWEEKKIKDILVIGNGKDYKHLKFGDIPVYGTGGIITYVDTAIYNGETVCIGRKGTINKPLFYNGKLWTVDTLFYTHSFVNCLPKFVYYLFKNINWLQYNEASGVPSLSKSTIEQIKIRLPNLSEQHKIVGALSSLEMKIENEEKILKLLELQKKYLLKNLFV